MDNRQPNNSKVSIAFKGINFKMLTMLTECSIIFIVSFRGTRWFKYDRDWFVQTYTQISPGHIWTTFYFENSFPIIYKCYTMKYGEWIMKGIKISCKWKINPYITYRNTNKCERILKKILWNFKKSNNKGNKITL